MVIPMRYDELLAVYPEIEYLFSGISELIHTSGTTPEMAAQWATDWINQHIGKNYQVPAAHKAHQFFAAIGGKLEEVAPCGTQMRFTEKPKQN